MIDEQFFTQRIAIRCEAAIGPRENRGVYRLIILQIILCRSVNGQSWRDAEDLAMRIGRPLKQCERVWELCLEESVLRPSQEGYSAIEWLKEKGYYNDSWKSERRDKAEEPGGKNNFMTPFKAY